MWPKTMWYTSHGHPDGSDFAILAFFWSNMKYFDLKFKYFVKKMGPKSQKGMSDVADGNHGGPGRIQEGQSGLDAEQTFW